MDRTKTIKIFEDKQQKVILTEQEIKDILVIQTIIGENRLILQVDGFIMVKHYVGFVQVNKTRLVIYPKITRNSLEVDIYQKSYEILMRLLIFSGFEGVKKLSVPQNMDKFEGDLFEVFIALFVDELLFQFKRDVNRGYINQTENQSFIKGKVDFTETIKQNAFKRHLHCVQYDHFNENILLNRIFKAVISNLITRSISKENKLKLKLSLAWLEDVEKIALTNEIWGKVGFTRQNTNYEAAYNMAKLFYYNSSPNLNIGDEYTFSFLLPVNRLFEHYMFRILDTADIGSYSVKYQNPTHYLAKGDKKSYFQLKPDITINKDNKVQFIIDAKYKELTSNNETLGANRDDIYQMLAYSIGYQCNNIVLFYPKFLSDNPNEFMIQDVKIRNCNSVVSIKLIKIDLEMDPSILGKKLLRELGI